LEFKEHKIESHSTEKIKEEIVKKTCHSLVSLNFEVEDIMNRKDEPGNYF